MATTRTGIRTAAVSSRAARLLTAACGSREPGRIRGPYGPRSHRSLAPLARSFRDAQPNLLRREAEAALAAVVARQRDLKLRAVEVGPQRVGEVHLRVRRFPQEEVRQPLLARRANDEIELGQPVRRQ